MNQLKSSFYTYLNSFLFSQYSYRIYIYTYIHIYIYVHIYRVHAIFEMMLNC